MTNNFSVSGPRSIYDWAAIRDEFREKLDFLDLEPMAVLYGLSRTLGFKDDDFAKRVEDLLDISSDPIRARFDIAYQLGSEFWETYTEWGMDDVQPGEPGYIGELLDPLHDTVLEWLLEGLSVYSNDPEVMDQAFFLVSRIGNFDTFLIEEDVPLMEAAARKEISLKASEGGRKLIQFITDTMKRINSREDKESDSLTDHSP